VALPVTLKSILKQKQKKKYGNSNVSQHCVFFGANFRNLATKKKAGESNRGIFEIKKHSPYLDKKT